MSRVELGEVSWERMIRAVEKVRERLLRATAALEKAGVPYAVVGGNAVAEWVSRADPSAVRNTPNVDVLLRRADLGTAAGALLQVGFVCPPGAESGLFLDRPQGKSREAVRVFFAGEKVRPGYLLPAPGMGEWELTPLYRVLTLPALVRMKLTSFRTIDQVHLRDLVDVGLIDASWGTRFPSELAMRLQELVDNPDG